MNLCRLLKLGVSELVIQYMNKLCKIDWGLILSGLLLGFFYRLKIDSKKYDRIVKIEEFSPPKQSRLLCLMLTYPSNKDKIKVIKETWIDRCDKVMLISQLSTGGIESVPIEYPKESRENLWRKVIRAFIWAHDNEINNFDWFMKMDDDTYVIMENLKRFLSKYDTNKPYYFGK